MKKLLLGLELLQEEEVVVAPEVEGEGNEVDGEGNEVDGEGNPVGPGVEEVDGEGNEGE